MGKKTRWRKPRAPRLALTLKEAVDYILDEIPTHLDFFLPTLLNGLTPRK
ncbi:MAG: hypothetical protein NTY03_03770 [Candidatus Bathyarchaeota archaeon]|nr:hypothetical protein [Candidatus Bathyarchaeota archaeon]